MSKHNFNLKTQFFYVLNSKFMIKKKKGDRLKNTKGKRESWDTPPKKVKV